MQPDPFARHRTVFAPEGIVSTAHPLGTLAGVKALQGGGTAMDAAVAAAAVHAVVNPGMLGLGGDTILLYYSARERRVSGLNATGRAPAAATLEEYRRRGLAEMPVEGPLAVTVPGALDGWAQALARHGTRTLADLLEDPIRYAEEGFPVYSSFVDFATLAGRRAAAFCPNGRVPGLGERVVQKDLAATLRLIAREGPAVFYRGALGERLVAAVRAAGGLLALEDLAEHVSEWVEPIATDYHGATVWEMPPNSQGVALLEQLNILAALDVGALPADSPERLGLQVGAARLALADLARHVTDPAFAAVPLDLLLSPAHAAAHRATLAGARGRGVPGGAATAHMSVVDRHGNVASFMGSLRNPFGCGLVAGDTGILLQNRGRDFSLDPGSVNRLAPRKRTRTTLNPILLTRGGAPYLALGCVGGHQQTQGLQQVLVHHLAGGLGLQEAIEMPRWAIAEDGALHVEPALAAAAAALAREGERVVVGQAFFGGCQAAGIDPATGARIGASDPRVSGLALGH